MNAARREQLKRAMTLVGEAWGILEAVADEEREAFENLPEGLQQADRGQAMEEIADKLDEIRDTLQSAEGDLEEAAA